MPGAAMKKLIVMTIALAAFAALTGSIYAQDKSPLQLKEEEKAREAKQIDKEYKAAKKRENAAATPAAATDPWANMRGTDEPKAKR